jgi:hypothetical protein
MKGIPLWDCFGTRDIFRLAVPDWGGPQRRSTQGIVFALYFSLCARLHRHSTRLSSPRIRSYISNRCSERVAAEALAEDVPWNREKEVRVEMPSPAGEALCFGLTHPRRGQTKQYSPERKWGCSQALTLAVCEAAAIGAASTAAIAAAAALIFAVAKKHTRQLRCAAFCQINGAAPCRAAPLMRPVPRR